MEPLYRSARILRDEGAGEFLWRALRFSWCETVWRRSLVQWLPVPVLSALFRLRSILAPHMSDANPIQPRWVDPNEIEYYQGTGPKRVGYVVDGEWDTPEAAFEDHPAVRSLEARFRDGVDWSETPLYEEYRERLEAGDPYWRCTTPEELAAYFEELDELYERISTEGYRSQRELLAEDPSRTRFANTDSVHPALQEIGVNIHRNGRIVKKGAGLHRLAIAQIAGVESVPVTVRVRHAHWQAVRDEIRRADSPAALSQRAREHLEHPDLRDIVPSEWRDEAAEGT